MFRLLRKGGFRFFSSVPRQERFGPVSPSASSRATRTWRDEPVPTSSLPSSVVPSGLPALRPGHLLPSPTLQHTTLPNGLHVSSQETYGQVATLALFIEAGSMYEGADEIGACHFFETTAYKATMGLSAAELLAFTQREGLTTSAVFNREVLVFKVEALRGSVDNAMRVIAEAALRPEFSDTVLEEARMTMSFQRTEAAAQPTILANELLHQAAYGATSTVGRPEKCPEERVPGMTAATLRAFAARNFTAPRMVLSCVGVEHDVAVASARRWLGDVPSVGPGGIPATPRPPAVYVGGDERRSPDWDAMPATVAAATAKTSFTHMMLAFPTVGWAEDDVIPICVVDTLLGGGSSFSAGGPGKGMYSRLYREVLNAFSWCESANAFSVQLYDSGLIGISGAAPPEHAGELASLLCGHLARLGHAPVREVELARARNQLASSVLMNLESRGVLVEDIGRQMLSHRKRLDPVELTRRIQRVTAEDITRVMQKALANKPSLTVVGETRAVPEFTLFDDFFRRECGRV